MNNLRWLTAPPVVAAGTFFLARLGSGEAVAIHPAVWALAGCVFLLLTGLYGLFIVNGFSAGLWGLQMALQGMLFCLLTAQRGSRSLPWLGVLVAVSGVAALVAAYHRSQLRRMAEAVERPEGIETLIPLPFALTDATGNIQVISDAFLKIADLTREKAVGRNIAGFLPLGGGGVDLGGKVWDLVQDSIDAHHAYFQLKEKAPAPKAEAKPAASAPSFIDPATHLHSIPYAMIRIDEELYRVRRYGHPLMAGLLRLVFPDDAEGDNSAGVAFNAYCSALKRGLRASDTVALADARTVLFVFPECPSAYADAILERLLQSMTKLGSSHGVLTGATALHAFVPIGPTDEGLGSKALLDRLNAELSRKYSTG